MVDEPQTDVLTRTLARVGAFDLGVATPVVLVWVVLGIVDLATMLVLTLLRMLALAWFLRAQLEPARGPLASRSDAELLAAERALTRCTPRVIVAWAAGWTLALIVGVGLARAGIPRARAFGDAELATGALILLAAVIAGSGMLATVLRSATHERHTQIGAQLLERELRPARRRTSLGAAIVMIALTQSFGGLIGMGALGGMLRVNGIREAALVEQRHLVERSLDRGGRASERVELRAPDELPAALREQLDASPPGEVVSLHAPRPSLAIAAARLDDGAVLVAEAPIEEQLGLFVALMLGLTLVGSLSGIPGGRAMASAVSDPIEQVNEATRRLVDGGDLRALARVVPLRDDELGRLALSFNELLDMLEELADAATTVANGDLRVELERPGELHDAFRGMLSQLHAMVAGIRETSLELASAAAEIHAITQQQEQAANRQTTSVREVSAMVTSLAETAEDIDARASEVLTNAERALTTSGVAAAKIDDLSAQAGSIGDLLDVIREVAERSDLLALNGSPEATRAGEAGRGFALVAGEMRRLAERVAATVDDVRERVADIRSAGAQSVHTTEDSRALVERTAAVARQISGLTQRQSGDTEQASLSVQSVAEIVVAAALATSQTRAASEGLREQAGQLERLIGAFELRSESARGPAPASPADGPGEIARPQDRDERGPTP